MVQLNAKSLILSLHVFTVYGIYANAKGYEMNETILGSELVQVRKAAKVSQADVAAKMGTDQSRVSRMEGDSKVLIEEARKYLVALDGYEVAKEFVEHIDSKWYSIPK